MTSSDIAHELEHRGFNIDRRKVQLDQPLKALGEFTVPIKLHHEVTTTVKVTIVKEKEVVEGEPEPA